MFVFTVGTSAPLAYVIFFTPLLFLIAIFQRVNFTDLILFYKWNQVLKIKEMNHSKIFNSIIVLIASNALIWQA